jgi:NAD(P)-dependent dehydrogenase (short-subunit alcohol dehydrogenase family)
MNRLEPRRLELRGATAFVTGGASGIGLAIARALVREGARVAIADISADWLAEATAELGDAATGLHLDVSDRTAWSAAREEAERQFGPVDVLVNNAGIGPSLHRLDEMDPARFDRMMAIKLTGTFNGIHEFVPGMRARRKGHVVNTASMAGLTASPLLGEYTAAKFAVVGLSEVLAQELREDGVGVSVLCPGLVATRLGETSVRAGVRPAERPHGDDRGIDAAIVGDLVVEAIRDNRLHVVTHGEHRTFVERRMSRVLGAFDGIPQRSSRQ